MSEEHGPAERDLAVLQEYAATREETSATIPAAPEVETQELPAGQVAKLALLLRPVGQREWLHVTRLDELDNLGIGELEERRYEARFKRMTASELETLAEFAGW